MESSHECGEAILAEELSLYSNSGLRGRMNARVEKN